MPFWRHFQYQLFLSGPQKEREDTLKLRHFKAILRCLWSLGQHIRETTGIEMLLHFHLKGQGEGERGVRRGPTLQGVWPVQQQSQHLTSLQGSSQQKWGYMTFEAWATKEMQFAPRFWSTVLGSPEVKVVWGSLCRHRDHMEEHWDYGHGGSKERRREDKQRQRDKEAPQVQTYPNPLIIWPVTTWDSDPQAPTNPPQTPVTMRENKVIIIWSH